jgi:phosphoenolpyruvate synthase/pyruvate phosphate dikinase
MSVERPDVAANEFLKVFDGYSIGSNDLTQLHQIFLSSRNGLVERGIDSISLNPDVAIKTALHVASAERRNYEPMRERFLL